MIKAVVLYTPAIGNIGNDFINQGAREFLNTFFKQHPDIDVTELEVLEIGNGAMRYPRDYLAPTGRKITEKADWIFFVGGSCLSRYYKNIFDDLKNFKAKKFLIGAGFYENAFEEAKMYSKLKDDFNHIFVRDDVTWKYLSRNGKYKNIYAGIDLGFFIDVEKIRKYQNREDYVIINMDSPECGDLIDEFYSKYDNAIIMWNSSIKTEVANSHHAEQNRRLLVAEKSDTYLRAISNAALIYTNRVHTFLAAILFDTPCEIWYGVGGDYDRHFLYQKIGLVIERSKRYFAKDYEQPKRNLVIEKAKMTAELNRVLTREFINFYVQ